MLLVPTSPDETSQGPPSFSFFIVYHQATNNFAEVDKGQPSKKRKRRRRQARPRSNPKEAGTSTSPFSHGRAARIKVRFSILFHCWDIFCAIPFDARHGMPPIPPPPEKSHLLPSSGDRGAELISQSVPRIMSDLRAYEQEKTQTLPFPTHARLPALNRQQS